MNSFIIVFALVAIVVASAHPPPPFGELMGQLTEAQRKELKAIFENVDLTRAQTKQAVKDWVSKQDEKIQKAFEEVEKKHEERKKEHEEEHAKRIANMSDEAKAVAEQVHAIFKDETLTRRQACEKVNEIASKTSDAIKAEVPRLRVRDCSKPRGPPGFGRGMGFGRGGRFNKQRKQD